MMNTDVAQAVYAAEDLWASNEFLARTRFGNWNEVWPFYYKISQCFQESGRQVHPPAVKARKGALKAHYDTASSTVFIPPYEIGGSWALTTATAIHEFAHHLSPGAGHGGEFRAAMVDCLNVLGWDSELLLRCYEGVGLTTSDKVDGITDKVNKLLLHADKAGTDEERRTYLEKAESMATEYSINLALVRKRQADKEDDGSRDRPMTGKLYSFLALPNVTYRNLAVELGHQIAIAHGAHCTIRGKSSYMTFYGFPEDVHITELVTTRVTPMMFEESDRYLKSPEHRLSGVQSTSARITFCKSFAAEIGNRLREAVTRVTEERIAAETATYGDDVVAVTGTELALRSKELEVADYVAHEFKRAGVKGSWSGSKTSRWSSSASSAGRTSARRANIYGRKELA